jgi:hypothetical protein
MAQSPTFPSSSIFVQEASPPMAEMQRKQKNKEEKYPMRAK